MNKLLLFLLSLLPFSISAQWQPSVSFPEYGLYKVDFPDLHAAYAIGDLGILYKSTDAGVTWAVHHDFGPFSSLSDVRFINADTGLVSLGLGQMITFDGGVNWSSLGAFPKVKVCQNILYTSFSSNDTTYIQQSLDYGNSWMVLYQHYEPDASPFILSFLNADSAYFINPHQLGQTYSTSDGFLSIDTIDIFSGDITLQEEFDFKDGTYGYLYGSWGTLSQPTRAWNVPIDLDGFGVLPVLDLDFTTSKLYASSLYGQIFVSGDHGSNWQVQAVPDNTPVYAVAFLNDSLGIAVGKGFYYTVNGGNATSIKPPAITSPFNIYPNPTNGHIRLEYAGSIQIQNIHLSNVAGQVVKTFKNDEKVLQVSGMASGVYFLTIQSAGARVTEPIVVQ